MVEPQVAATVMIAREDENGISIFMLRRSSRSAFMPDIFVFPGGRVEAQDGSLQARERLAGDTARTEPAYTFAAARETFEECGLLFALGQINARTLTAARARMLAQTSSFSKLLTELDTRIDSGALHYFSRWITPPLEPRRFDTHFFVARAPAGQTAEADATETHDGVWITPREALQRHAEETFALSFPTIKHLERIQRFDSVDTLLDFAAHKQIETVTPHVDPARRFSVPSRLEEVW